MTMVNIKEIMLGDWLCGVVDGHKYPGTVIKIDDDIYIETTEMPEDFEDWYDPFDDIEPIPLTKDILAKNGFKPMHNGDVLIHKDEHGSETVIMYIDIEYIKVINKNCDREYSGPVHNVHEMQHALKLCGFKKKIEL